VDVPEAVLKELKIIFVDHMDQVTEASIVGELKYANGIYPVKRKASRRQSEKDTDSHSEE